MVSFMLSISANSMNDVRWCAADKPCTPSSGSTSTLRHTGHDIEPIVHNF